MISDHRQQLAYYRLHPEKVPSSPLLSMALPLAMEDLETGELGLFVMELSASQGFREMPIDRLQDCVAIGFGYRSWEALIALDATNKAPYTQLPSSHYKVLDVMAWRMYAGGFVGLADAVIATQGAWQMSLVTLKKRCGYLGSTRNVPEVPAWDDFCTRVVPGMVESWRQWDGTTYAADGTLRLKWAAELAWGSAASCWTPDCGVSLQTVNSDIVDGAHMSVAQLIDRSWMFNSSWPIGLEPIQLMTTEGTLAGYGWFWPELGLTHASVFGTTADFKKSAVALWGRQSTAEYALRELPATLVQVDFVNPWSSRDKTREMSAQMLFCIDIEKRFAEGPWMDMLTTREGRIARGHDVSLDGEPWTRPVNSLRPELLDGLLGLQLATFNEVLASDDGAEWLEEKIPYAMDRETYETGRRLWVSLALLAEREVSWLATEPTASSAMRMLLKLSARQAKPVPARTSETHMRDPIMRLEIQKAGREMMVVYPELGILSEASRGEYGLAYYGKNGLRHDRLHHNFDLEFAAYCVLRNLDVDPAAIRASTAYLALFRLVRLHSQKQDDERWSEGPARRELSAQARQLNTALRLVDSIFEDLDQSLTPSRLNLIRQSAGQLAEHTTRAPQ